MATSVRVPGPDTSKEHIKRLLGHASTTATSRYLHLDLDELTTAA